MTSSFYYFHFFHSISILNLVPNFVINEDRVKIPGHISQHRDYSELYHSKIRDGTSKPFKNAFSPLRGSVTFLFAM